MSEESVKSSKACVHILGGSVSNWTLFDFDGVCILDGGMAEKSTGFVDRVQNVSGVILSAPTKNNLGMITALLEQNGAVPVYTNTTLLKRAKPGSSGEQMKQIQEANANLLAVRTPIFSPRYQPYIIYQSDAKGILSLYVLAGDARDGEAITKALASGNEAEVERAAAAHGTIGVLLWRPAERNTPVVRVLISGTSSLARIQQSLDKAAKHLPFLNTAIVKSKDALSHIPAPSSTTGSARPLTARGNLVRPTPPRTRPVAPTARATTAAASYSRPATAKPSVPSRVALTANALPATRTRSAAPTTSRPTAFAKKPIATTSRAPLPMFTRSSPATVAQKKPVGKVPGPSKPAAKPAPISKTAAPAKKPSTPATARRTPVVTASDLDDSVICLTDLNQGSSRSPKVSTANGKPDPIPSEVPIFEDVAPVTPLVNAADIDQVPAHSEPSAPVVPADHAIISSEDPALLGITETVPFAAHVPEVENELITLNEDKAHVATSFEEPHITQTPGADGTLTDCSKDISNLDTPISEVNKTESVGEITQLSSDLHRLGLNNETNLRKISNNMVQDATSPFTRALASSIVREGEITSLPNGGNDHEENVLVEFETNGHNGSDQQTEKPKETSKHFLMQSRSSVFENGALVQYEKTDPVIDDILAACADESDKLDAAHYETLHLPERPGVVFAKSIKFARHYYFDVVTVPHNENQELTLNCDALREFVSKIRSRNLILPSKDISAEQLCAVVAGKQTWCESGQVKLYSELRRRFMFTAHPCTVIPTHSSPTLVDFRRNDETLFQASFLSFVMPVDEQKTTTLTLY